MECNRIRGTLRQSSVGFSLFLVAAGAILRYAVTWIRNGVNMGPWD